MSSTHLLVILLIQQEFRDKEEITGELIIWSLNLNHQHFFKWLVLVSRWVVKSSTNNARGAIFHHQLYAKGSCGCCPFKWFCTSQPVKYTKNIHFVGTWQPGNETQQALLKWLSTPVSAPCCVFVWPHTPRLSAVVKQQVSGMLSTHSNTPVFSLCLDSLSMGLWDHYCRHNRTINKHTDMLH